MELQSARKQLEEVAHLCQELKNSYMRLDDNLKQEFKIGYGLDLDVDELARVLFDWSEIQHDRHHGKNQ
ncbi:hypothetical protein ACFO4L_04540 [Bacillus daqingensis]|uniref:Uncharacterized protein n=2 Tax=Bacillaceae TaxID=186817 RepID=A0A969TY65_9BACI|nr:hypothetical protein [Alkalicoccus luteus]NJP38889.1 hypothetical protein [Alkalicoccus luteus]